MSSSRSPVRQSHRTRSPEKGVIEQHHDRIIKLENTIKTLSKDLYRDLKSHKDGLIDHQDSLKSHKAGLIDHRDTLNIHQDDLRNHRDHIQKLLSDITILQNKVTQLEKDLQYERKQHEHQIETLTDSLNESREQIQALLDYCFTDRSRWKEGISTSGQARSIDTLDVRKEGACSSSIQNECSSPIPSLSSGELPYSKNE